MTISQPVITIQRHPFNSVEGRQLISALDAELSQMYPDWESLPHPNVKGNPQPTTANSESAFEEPSSLSKGSNSDLTFLVAFTSPSEAVGCIALHQRDDIAGYPPDYRVGEVKRMYVAPEFRGTGLSRRLLQRVKDEARDVLKLKALVLETGKRQVGAVKLYERDGWKKRQLYGEYIGAGVEDGGVSGCYELVL